MRSEYENLLNCEDKTRSSPVFEIADDSVVSDLIEMSDSIVCSEGGAMEMFWPEIDMPGRGLPEEEFLFLGRWGQQVLAHPKRGQKGQPKSSVLSEL